jgi:hypothetical protein
MALDLGHIDDERKLRWLARADEEKPSRLNERKRDSGI